MKNSYLLKNISVADLYLQTPVDITTECTRMGLIKKSLQNIAIKYSKILGNALHKLLCVCYMGEQKELLESVHLFWDLWPYYCGWYSV
jgi:hypothetical protein